MFAYMSEDLRALSIVISLTVSVLFDIELFRYAFVFTSVLIFIMYTIDINCSNKHC